MIAPAIALAAVAWLSLLVLAPLATPSIAALVYTVGGVICHQIPERSFHLAGIQLPVCARCLGIYIGAAAAASMHLLGSLSTNRASWRLLSPRQARRLFVLAAAPTLVTFVLDWAGVWHTSNVVRTIAGVLVGAGAALVVMSAVATLHYSECLRRPPIEPSRIPPRI